MMAPVRSVNVVGAVLWLTASAIAGPPFQADDLEPMAFRHYEAYAFGTADDATMSSYSQFPAFESDRDEKFKGRRGTIEVVPSHKAPQRRVFQQAVSSCCDGT